MLDLPGRGLVPHGTGMYIGPDWVYANDVTIEYFGEWMFGTRTGRCEQVQRQGAEQKLLDRYEGSVASNLKHGFGR